MQNNQYDQIENIIQNKFVLIEQKLIKLIKIEKNKAHKL